MKRVLIISSNRLGDAILSSGLNNYFKEKYKDSQITFVCGEIPYDLFRYCKNIDTIVPFKKRRYSFHWLILFIKIFFKSWEEVIDLRGSIISFFLFTKKRKIFRKNKQRSIHKVEEITTNITGKLVEPKINILKINFKNKFRGKKVVCICPTANWAPKIWPEENFHELIKKISIKSKFKNHIFVLIGPKSEEYKIKGLLSLKDKKIFNMFGKFSLVEIFLFLRECKLFIGNDSGLMHLAALAKVRTVGLFGPSSIEKYHPWGKKTLHISGDKSPDDLMGHKNFDFKQEDCLMEDLKVDYVLKKIIKFYR